LQLPAQGAPQVRVVPHFQPLYRIEGEASRTPEGIYDRMRAVGAHEIVIESPDHNQWLGRMRDDEIERVLEAYVLRITDLKRDSRFKYVTVFQNRGAPAGEEWAHPYSQVTASMFVPRRILYELSSAREWFDKKERCVFCDIVRQEEKQGVRIVDVQGDYVAFCLCFACPLRGLAHATPPQPSIRAAATHLQPASLCRAAGPDAAATGADRPDLPSRAAHGSQH
jgi:UDPglucose--hexose-1-phosphate uridylyltransferase